MSDRLAPGDTAPDFTLPSDTGDEVALSDLRGKKVIVYFYPAAMTPGCTTQACDFTDSIESLRGSGYEVLGISPDKPEKLAKFRERDHLTITLLSDPAKETLAAYDLAGRLVPERALPCRAIRVAANAATHASEAASAASGSATARIHP